MFSAARIDILDIDGVVQALQSGIPGPALLKSFCHLHIENVNSWNQSACQCLSLIGEMVNMFLFVYLYICIAYKSFDVFKKKKLSEMIRNSWLLTMCACQFIFMQSSIIHQF